MSNNNSFWQKIKLNLFCLNGDSKQEDDFKKIWKHRIAIIIGKIIFIIIDKLIGKFF